MIRLQWNASLSCSSIAAAPAPPAVAPAPVAPDAPRYLVDPVTGEQVLAQPVTPPSDGTPRA